MAADRARRRRFAVTRFRGREQTHKSLIFTLWRWFRSPISSNMLTNSWRPTCVRFLLSSPSSSSSWSQRWVYSSFSRTFDSVEVRRGVVVHKGQEQLGCSSCSSPLSLVLRDSVQQTSASWKPSESGTGYIWVPNSGCKNVSQSSRFPFCRLLVHTVTHLSWVALFWQLPSHDYLQKTEWVIMTLMLLVCCEGLRQHPPHD